MPQPWWKMKARDKVVTFTCRDYLYAEQRMRIAFCLQAVVDRLAAGAALLCSAIQQPTLPTKKKATEPHQSIERTKELQDQFGHLRFISEIAQLRLSLNPQSIAAGSTRRRRVMTKGDCHIQFRLGRQSNSIQMMEVHRLVGVVKL